MKEIITVFPEILLASLTCLIMVIDVFLPEKKRAATFWLSILSILGVLVVVATWLPSENLRSFHGNFISDPVAIVMKSALLIVVLMSFFYAKDFFERHEGDKNTFFILALFSTLGMMFLISANTLLTVYLGLELLSLSLYAMVAMDRDSPKASEAAMKYFVLGAMASGLLLYGMSMLYGVSGTLDLAELSTQELSDGNRILYAFGLVFILIGIAFKLGVAPFHMWVPDVYEGASTPVALFLSSAPKLAAFVMALRLLAEGLGGLAGDWQIMLISLAIISMGLGNVIAIAQTNFKRMLAYSTIAHMGFLLLGIATANVMGYSAAMFYVIVYAVMGMGAFGAIILLSTPENSCENLDDLKGLARRTPWTAFVLLIVIFSLAGVPPFAGFWAKWFVLKEVVAAGYAWLAALAVFFSLIGAFYYLRVIKLMYFDEGSETLEAVQQSEEARLIFSLNGVTILLLGLLPGALMSVCLGAMFAVESLGY